MTAPNIHNTVNGSDLLAKLLNKGDQISIVQGQLLIKPSSGLAVPPTWLKQHESLLINDICQLFNITALRYASYSTGSYGSKKSEGITLQFNNLQTNDDAYLIFNASLKRARTGKRGKKGEQLPGKQFIVSERSSFYKFWCSTGLPLPRSLSKFYECMGKLKPLVFTGKVDFNNRVAGKKISLLDVSYQQILTKSNTTLSGKNQTNLTAKEPLRFRQGTAKTSLSFTAKDIELDHASIDVAPNQSTCAAKYGNTVIRKEVISKGVSTDITPINNTIHKEIEENLNRAISQKTQPEDTSTDEWLADWESSFSPDEFKEVMTDFSLANNPPMDKAS